MAAETSLDMRTLRHSEVLGLLICYTLQICLQYTTSTVVTRWNLRFEEGCSQCVKLQLRHENALLVILP